MRPERGEHDRFEKPGAAGDVQAPVSSATGKTGAAIPGVSEAQAPSNPNHRRVSEARLFIRALGVSFFSVLSVLAALYAFVEMPQVQDVLLDARPYWIQEVVYWTSFYLIGIFIWALPLVFTSRLLLLQNFDLIGIDTEERFKFYIFVMPRFYAVLAFIAVFVGMVSASGNLPSPSKGNRYEFLLKELLKDHLLYLCIATAALVLIFMIRDVFISYYRRKMELLEIGKPESCRKELIRIENITRKPTRKHEEHDVHLTALKPAFVTTHTWIAAQRAKLFMWVYMSVLTCLLVLLVAIHFLSYSDMVREVFAAPDLSSHPGIQAAWDFLADTFALKRAPLLFILFGAWLPFLTIMALFSNRYQFPFITAFIFAGVVITLFVGDGHHVRIAALSKEQQASLKPISFAGAVVDWKAASGWNTKGCEQLPAGAPGLDACPRPIIVAGEGGGSRAAFLLASVLGALEDDSLDRQRNPTARPFHTQLFAISSVSGSSVGAAFFVSALKVQPNAALGKLKKALYKQSLWFPNVADAKAFGAPGLDPERASDGFLTDFVTYKDALQAALSNDFISPTLTGYLARDIPMLSQIPFVMDRAGVLETAWEDAFDAVYGTSRRTSPLSGPLQAQAPSPESWIPLLFMNATSTETGRRVIVTPVKINEPIGTGNSALFADSYDLHELLCSPYRHAVISPLDEIGRALPSLFSPEVKCAGGKPVSADIRLSTAASVSSRSPFITPHAGIRGRTAQLTDSVVDGGFFDNSGIITALDAARGVKAVDARLMPFILQVSNEPAWFEGSNGCAADGSYPARPQIPDEAIFRPLSTLTDLLTVNSTRISRGYETILELRQRASQLNGGLPSAAQIHVCPQPQDSFFGDMLLNDATNPERAEEQSIQVQNKMEQQAQYKRVSLSWWLSPPLQAYLDGQIYSKYNMNERRCVISLLKDSQSREADACH